MKRLILPPIIAALILINVFVPNQGKAHTGLDEINNQLEELRIQKNAAEKKAKEAQNRINDIVVQKKGVESDMEQLYDQLEQIITKITTLRADIENVENEMKQTEEQLEKAIERVLTRDDLLKSRLRLMYTNGSVSYMEVLLGSTSFSDFLDRYNSIKTLVGQDKNLLESNKRDQQLIEKKKEQVETFLTSLTNRYEEMEGLKQSFLVQEKKKEVLIASLNREEEVLGQITEEQEKVLITAARKEAELQAERSKQANQKENYSEGKFIYPLPKIFRLSSNFGSRVDPITGKKGAFHSGLDIAAPGGTDVLAAENGKVIVAQLYGGYGNTVIIDHGNGVWTLYAHMRSINVSKGDSVDRGDQVGAVGTTGRSTGNHLHFEVRVNERAVDPKQYINI